MLLAGRQTTSGGQNDCIGSGEIVLEALLPAKVAAWLRQNRILFIGIASLLRNSQ